MGKIKIFDQIFFDFDILFCIQGEDELGDYEDYDDDEGLDEDELDDLMEEDGVKDEL